MRYVTARDLRKLSSPACPPQYWMGIPRGTRCRVVDGRFVVDDTSKVTRGGSGDALLRHDLAHYYIWLEPDEVIGA